MQSFASFVEYPLRDSITRMAPCAKRRPEAGVFIEPCVRVVRADNE